MIGQTISHYEIVKKLGGGGMGVVYEARDLKLHRRVALKFLPQEVSTEEEVKARFTHEARAASALDHLNICTVYDIDETDDGRMFIVMAHYAGETLKKKIQRGPLPLAEALNFAIQIAQGLAKAHQKNIVHRDIKPANVIVTEDGVVKIVDFGLAQLGDATKLTKTGSSLGTPAYMSAEQVQRQPLDRRTDIWSLGVVLYEMITGQVPFPGDMEAAVAYAILHEEPEPLTGKRSGLPLELDRIVAKALAKKPDERYQHADEIVVDLRVVAKRPGAAETLHPRYAPATKPTRSTATEQRKLFAGRRTTVDAVQKRRWWAWGLAGIALAALGVFAIPKWQDQSPQTSSVAAGPVPFTSLRGSEERPAFSPDGTRVAFSWSGETGDNVDIYVQVVGSSNRLRLTDNPGIDETPSWSPDGRQIAFVRISSNGQAIYATSSIGGPEKKVTEFLRSAGGIETFGLGRPGSASWSGGGLAWTPDGKSILFCESESPGEISSIYRFELETGEKQRVTFPQGNVGNLGDAFPAISPDGQTLAFARGSVVKREVYVMPLEGGEPRELSSQGQVTVGLAWTADSREIIYAKTPTLAGVLGGLWRIPASGGDPTAVPAAGQDVRYPAVSPQGNRLVYERADFDANLWAYPLPGDNSGASPRPVAASTYVDHEPRISPDGNRIVFASNRTGRFQIWVSDRDGANIVQLTSLDGWGAGSPRWSPDGRHIAFDSNVHGHWDIFVVDALGGSPRRLTISEERDARPSWSHDGRWIYFTSERTGTAQVWKVPPEGGDPTQLTRGGGHQPFESPDGRFLYFTRTPSDLSVWRMPIEAGEEKAVQLVPNTTNWVVVKNGLYFVEYREATPASGKWFLRLLPSNATEPVDVMAVPRPWWASALDIAPDGTWFIYAQSQLVGSDVMLLENFE